MRSEIREAFEAAIVDERVSGFASPKFKSNALIRREATLLMKQFERVFENLPDQSISVLELYEEIAGMAHHG